MNPICRGDQQLSPQKFRDLEVWHEAAVRKGLMK